MKPSRPASLTAQRRATSFLIGPQTPIPPPQGEGGRAQRGRVGDQACYAGRSARTPTRPASLRSAGHPPPKGRDKKAEPAAHRRSPSPCGQGNRICVNKTGISLLLDSVRSVNDSYLFTHMRLPCPFGGGIRRP